MPRTGGAPERAGRKVARRRRAVKPGVARSRCTSLAGRRRLMENLIENTVPRLLDRSRQMSLMRHQASEAVEAKDEDRIEGTATRFGHSAGPTPAASQNRIRPIDVLSSIAWRSMRLARIEATSNPQCMVRKSGHGCAGGAEIDYSRALGSTLRIEKG